jgi:hypothetical protein
MRNHFKPAFENGGRMIMKKGLMLFLLLLAIPFMAHAGGTPNMEPGLWEITSETHMQGMNMPPSTVTQCITNDDLVPRPSSQPGQQQDCEITDVKVSGDTVTWRMRCTGEGGTVEGEGSITYHGDRFEGSSTINIIDAGMSMQTQMTGRRVGECQ